MFNINTSLMTNHTHNGPQKGWQVETPSRVGKSGATLVFWCFCPAFREWLHDARCFDLEGCHQIGKLLTCAPDMLHPFQLGSGLTMSYHDLPTAVYKVVRGWNARTNISKLWDPHPQCHWEEMVSMLVLNCSCTWTHCSKGPCALETLEMHR